MAFTAESQQNLCLTQFIYPCTEEHILKYSAQGRHLFRESWETHQKVTRPFIDSLDHPNKNAWLYDVLEGKKETEFRVVEKPDWLLNLDWECTDPKNATYCLALPQDRTLQTVRNLTGQHLPMLKDMLESSMTAIKEKFGVPRSEIRAFFHYPPTYYHLHIHFCHTNITDKVNCVAGRAILLEDVIENIELDPEYY